MSGGILVAGLGIVGFLLILLFFKLGDSDAKYSWILQTLILSFIVGLFVLVSKTAVDNEDYCAYVVNSSLTNTTSNSTSYTYTYLCTENTNETAYTFYNVTIWIFRLVVIYILLYFMWEAIDYLQRWSRGDRG